jgi:protein tyrosine/serine phosphatase
VNQKDVECGPGLKWRRAKRPLFAALVASVLLGGYVAEILIHHNFHEVSPGKVYRSSQMSSSVLSDIVQRWGIRTVVNLRGASPDQSWYRQETNVLGNLGVSHEDFALSAGRELGEKEIDSLMEIIRKSPKPILMHCNGGADRSGLISALYLYILEGKNARTACGQLTVFYGHVPYLHWRYSIAMDRSFWKYVKAHPQSTRDDAASWLNPGVNSAKPCYPRAVLTVASAF